MTSVKTIALLTAAAIAVGITAAGLAVATGSLKTAASQTENFDQEGNGEARAQCKGKLKAVSGGFEYVGPNDTSGIVKTAKRDKRRGWEVGMVSALDAERLKAYAYCRKAEGLVNSSDSEILPDSTVEEITVNCPTGTRVISGGTLAALSPDVYVHASHRRDGNTWETSWISYDTNQSATATVTCYDGPPLKQVSKSKTFDFSGSADYKRVNVTATCPQGHRAVSGGFKSNIELSKAGPLIDVSRRVRSRKWRLEATASFYENLKLTAYAYCERI
jgi:hypothetical protein